MGGKAKMGYREKLKTADVDVNEENILSNYAKNMKIILHNNRVFMDEIERLEAIISEKDYIDPNQLELPL